MENTHNKILTAVTTSSPDDDSRPDFNPPAQWFDLTKVYEPEIVIPLLERRGAFSPNTQTALKCWFDEAGNLTFEQYRKFLRGQFRCLAAAADPRAPLDLLIQWADTTGRPPATSVLPLWIGELLSLVYPNDGPETLQERVTNALSDRRNIWEGAYWVGRQLWKDLSKTQIALRLTLYLADHTAANLWGSKWLMGRVWPQTARREPYITEQRDEDLRLGWETMQPAEAVRCAQAERIFGQVARSQLADYNAEHPLAHRVKIESPKSPPQGQKAFLLIFTVLPLALHHNWSLIDFARCLAISHPHLASALRGKKCAYIRKALLTPLGLKDFAKRRGRPVGSNNDRLPRAFGIARVSPFAFRNSASPKGGKPIL